jgi:hypothetical protein
MRLPAGAYKLCTTIHPEKFDVGSEVVNRSEQRKVRVVALLEAIEDGETVYDVYVVDIHDAS